MLFKGFSSVFSQSISSTFSVACALACSTVSFSAVADFLPPNTLDQDDLPFLPANISQEEFKTLIQSVVDAYQPLAALHGAHINTYNDWEGSTVNASAQQQGNAWLLNFFGGLARRPEVTPDAFTLVVCHEMGHHFAGFPLKSLPMPWSATEGEADYFATHACARKLWSNDTTINAAARPGVEPVARQQCDSAFSTEAEQNLCYRAAMASKSLGLLVSALKKTPAPAPEFDTPSNTKVNRTALNHADPQCRLDTFFAGALCSVRFNETVIPGKRFLGLGAGSAAAEKEAYANSCSFRAEFSRAQRPRCWFKPRENF